MLSCAVANQAMAQITNVHGTIEDEFGPLMGATVCEVDANGRIISGTQTDMNGNFTMSIRNPKDKLRFQFLGMKTQTVAIDKTSYTIVLESESTQLNEVEVKAVKRMKGNGLSIPETEVSFSKQSISMSEFEGLGITTVDEALQGRVAGLDIVSLSGNLGSGSVMRLRGASSLSTLTNGNPLIVVDGNVWDVDMSNFDLSSGNDEKFAELLNIQTEDIADIVVKKDNSATAIYGSQGGNGVIEITTRRGARGKPKLTYSCKLTSTYQPEGVKLLSGDDYTMLLKESYFNPAQSDAASNIPEINYDPTFSEYEQYNNNTDWRKAVTQWGLRQNHNVAISGGGERAQFRISAGLDNETGSVIEQELSRITTRSNLDYTVSRRIKVQTNFAMTYTKNNRNSDALLSIAQRKMPNMSIYEQDPVTGEDTDRYYNMLQSGSHIGSEVFKDDQRTLVNPVASAHLAKNVSTTYNLQPELAIDYELLGMDDDSFRLHYRGQVYMNIFNEYVDRYYPSELVTTAWTSGHNTSYKGSSKSLSITNKHTLTFNPYIPNRDHTLSGLVRMEMTTGSSNGQSTNGSGLPSDGPTSPDAGGKNTGLGSSYAEWRSLYFTGALHYVFKGRYIFDLSMRADGTTKFGPDRRWGYFPAASARWNVIDEPFMKRIKEDYKVSMLAVKYGWGKTGHAPNRDYLYTSKYGSGGNYLDMTSMRPVNLRLTNLQWETVKSHDWALEFGFFDRINATFEVYKNTTSDMLMSYYRIPSNFGYASVDYRNSGKLSNTGWEFFINTNNMIKKGKFTMDMNVNFGNNRNEILEMDELVLNNLNTTFNNENAQVLTRIQLHNPFGAIYGFKSKGVYQYEYETFAAMSADEQMAFLAAGKTAPIALAADGTPIYNEKGAPIRMMFNYSNDGSGRNYTFKGGDAIYEDVNNDGQINALDICYLGSSLPKLMGGFGFNWRYGDWKLSTQFTYRLGNKIINMARLNMESMSSNNNQSQAVNYRWRKEGDVTSIPRAMYGATSNYNTLLSDRFVEKGDYLRMSYAQLSYQLPKEWVKKARLSRTSLYVSANNPFVLTKYTGVDPDVSSGWYGPSVDNGQTPRARSFTAGITIDF